MLLLYKLFKKKKPEPKTNKKGLPEEPEQPVKTCTQHSRMGYSAVGTKRVQPYQIYQKSYIYPYLSTCCRNIITLNALRKTHSSIFLCKIHKFRTKKGNLLSDNRKHKDMVHIGNIIKEIFDEQGLSASWLAKQLCCDRTNIYSIFKRESIDTSLLVKISVILKHDFFKYYSKDLENSIDK